MDLLCVGGHTTRLEMDGPSVCSRERAKTATTTTTSTTTIVHTGSTAAMEVGNDVGISEGKEEPNRQPLLPLVLLLLCTLVPLMQ